MASLVQMEARRSIQDEAKALAELRQSIRQMIRIYEKRRAALVERVLGEDFSPRGFQLHCPDCPKGR